MNEYGTLIIRQHVTVLRFISNHGMVPVTRQRILQRVHSITREQATELVKQHRQATSSNSSDTRDYCYEWQPDSEAL